MKLCEEQKITIILAISAIWVILCIFLYSLRVKDTQVDTLVVALLALLVGWSVPSLLYLFKIRRERKERQLRKLNAEVFKKWKEVSVEYDRFYVEYTFKTPIEMSAYEQGKRYLQSSKETEEIYELWGHLNSLRENLNSLGNNIAEAVKAVFSANYPSLKRSLEFSDSFHNGCYISNNIMRLVNEIALRLVSNEEIFWERLVQIETYTNTLKPTFRLVDHGVLIQSKDPNDVDKRRFQNTMKILEPRIISDMKKLITLYNDISQNMGTFKRRMNELSYNTNSYA